MGGTITPRGAFGPLADGAEPERAEESAPRQRHDVPLVGAESAVGALRRGASRLVHVPSNSGDHNTRASPVPREPRGVRRGRQRVARRGRACPVPLLAVHVLEQRKYAREGVMTPSAMAARMPSRDRNSRPMASPGPGSGSASFSDALGQEVVAEVRVDRRVGFHRAEIATTRRRRSRFPRAIPASRPSRGLRRDRPCRPGSRGSGRRCRSGIGRP